jgi:hypothetical protein
MTSFKHINLSEFLKKCTLNGKNGSRTKVKLVNVCEEHAHDDDLMLVGFDGCSRLQR